MDLTKNNRNTLLGILILSIGTLLLMDNFNLIDFPIRQYIFSWKTLLIIIGAAILIRNKEKTGGYILITIGVVFWLPELLNNQLAVKQILLPALFLVVGVSLLSKALRPRRKSSDHVDEAEIIDLANEKNG